MTFKSEVKLPRDYRVHLYGPGITLYDSLVANILVHLLRRKRIKRNKMIPISCGGTEYLMLMEKHK